MNNREVEIKMEIKDKAQVENIRKFLQENEGQRPQSIVMKAIYYDTEEKFYQKQLLCSNI